jgi:predicted transcriptional regulator
MKEDVNKMKRKRSLFEMNFSILDAVSVSRVLQRNTIALKTGINNTMLNDYLSKLELKGYVKREEFNRNTHLTLKPKLYGYKITPIGSRVYLQIKSIINIFD